MSIKIICLNMWRGGLLFDAIFEFLEKEQPDILMLQEVFDGDDPAMPARFRTLPTMQDRLHFPACEFAPALLDNEEGYKFHSGNAVLSRLPITAHTAIPYDRPFAERTQRNAEAWATTPRNLQHVVVDADGVELNILNTQGVWDLDGMNPSDRRAAMCQTIADTAAGLPHVIFAGDTNLNPTNVTLAPIGAILTPVFAKDELPTSFNVRRKDLVNFPGYATAVVDLMYASNDIEVVAHGCPDIDISDHLPLIAEIMVK